ncbi:formyltetrahydrofolate deformylase [Helicobacter saguini]|uniref:Formyltetrahydrofolate deformylase n=1 Tax=Helicobacter saguini TaxID=1548018 RepID=A0A347VT88_9HELI|nr:formyltetrahydrofolate deformylase [Helicobacter saguini]MWV62195.1 formyltetrahydrofolate deformylase [Helicobacter saguini]MWV67131.1 formyltetrahydrofolate deformylase [Helicobacter saguini]MWV69482.1 formyltetrahydrofolate deformylase [Helicobacter saguini]MWV70966.1 formyltetrahydrofolate deformylase [Helicobacter saguini]TLD92947.1 formyltetrahydrofolate deformylase [Helicobacter saguini]
MRKIILLIKCKDTQGLVFKVSSVLYKYGLNIEQNSEFVDKSSGMFFMRTEISGLDSMESTAFMESKQQDSINPNKIDSNITESITLDSNKLLKEIESALNNNAQISIKTQDKKSIIILATKENHCLGDLLIRHSSGELNAKILCVISNHNVLQSLVKKFDIPYYFIDSNGISREKHEKEILKICKNFSADFLVLAKYMRVLSPSFVARFKDKIINIHHSFLPAFIGANPYKQAYERGVKIIGATAHFVSDELDCGPIICQDVAQINHSYTWQDMQKAGRDIEKIVLARALNLALEDRIFLNGNKTIVF